MLVASGGKAAAFYSLIHGLLVNIIERICINKNQSCIALKQGNVKQLHPVIAAGNKLVKLDIETQVYLKRFQRKLKRLKKLKRVNLKLAVFFRPPFLHPFG